MAFSRQIARGELLTGAELDSAMVGIGMEFAAPPRRNANIEDTVISASVVGVQGDFRVLSVLVTWLGVHHERLNADRLVKLVRSQHDPRVQSFWTALALWLKSDRRFARLQDVSCKRLDLLAVGTDFQIRRRGEDPRFAGGPFRVPAGVLRDRPQDVLSPADLAERHSTYRHRILIGPSYRADMWAELTRSPDLSPAELARRSYGSFATAWQVSRDFKLLVRERPRSRKAS